MNPMNRLAGPIDARYATTIPCITSLGPALPDWAAPLAPWQQEQVRDIAMHRQAFDTTELHPQAA